MIFQELILRDVGPFAGENRLVLAPSSPASPVILLGGLNGAGKTTLLDSLSLALYGKHARLSKRGDVSYEDFLRHLINHNAEPEQGASVELELRYQEEGCERIERVRRAWSIRGGQLREQCEVFVNGRLDLALSDSWIEHIQSLLPARLAELFFFDAEKIERLADPRECQELLRTGVHLLLGVDLVDQLFADLRTVERRQRQQAIEKSELDQLRTASRTLEQEIGTTSAKLDDVRQRIAAQANIIAGLEKDLDKVNEAYQREGGDRVERRDQGEQHVAALRGRWHSTQEALKDIAAEATPLLLLEPGLADLEELHRTSERRQIQALLVAALQDRDEQVVARLSKERRSAGGTSADPVVESLRKILSKDRAQRAQTVSDHRDSPLVTPDAFAQVQVLLGGELDRLRTKLAGTLLGLSELQTEIDKHEAELANTPPPEAVADLLERRAQLSMRLTEVRHAAERLIEEQRQLGQTRTTLLVEYEKLLETVGLGEHQRLQQQRIVATSEAARKVITQFRELLVRRHIHRIEEHILKCFQSLLRKRTLVHHLSIDPSTFALLVYDGHGRPVAPNRLSSGERQLLAVAVLWGLLRACGRQLPVVIDTPLGRLDSTHRRRLIERYFPSASHQVLLLSTDEEVTRPMFDLLKPSVSRSYTLEHADAEEITKVRDGYFFEVADSVSVAQSLLYH